MYYSKEIVLSLEMRGKSIEMRFFLKYLKNEILLVFTERKRMGKANYFHNLVKYPFNFMLNVTFILVPEIIYLMKTLQQFHNRKYWHFVSNIFNKKVVIVDFWLLSQIQMIVLISLIYIINIWLNSVSFQIAIKIRKLEYQTLFSFSVNIQILFSLPFSR